MLLDLSDVTFMDSAGIGRLLQVVRQCRETNHPFALLRPSPQVRKILSNLRLESQVPVVEKAEDFPARAPAGVPRTAP